MVVSNFVESNHTPRCIVFSFWKTQMDIHGNLYKQLLKIIPDAENPNQYGKSKVSGLMDLNFVLSDN